MSVATKIAIQLNCKLGGEVWHLEIPVCKLIYILKIFLGFIGKIGVSLSSTFIVVYLFFHLCTEFCPTYGLGKSNNVLFHSKVHVAKI